MAKKIRVSLVGATGYAGAELLRRLLRHPNVEVAKVVSIDNVGENVGKVHRNFRDKLPYIFEDLKALEVAGKSDLVFFTMPHKVSFMKIPEYMAFSHLKLIDFSGDYRIQDPKHYEQYYKVAHSNPENIKKFVYGLPELNRELIRGAKYISNPGCFATATALAMLPIARAGLLKGKLRVVGPTGSSGSGVKPSEGTHHPIRCRNLKSYKPLDHQHLPEMEQTLVAAGAKNISIDFIPISAPITRGILVNCIIDVPANTTPAEIDQAFHAAFDKEPFVHLCQKGEFPEIVGVAESNFCSIGWTLRENAFEGSKSLAIVSAIDNLVKGASGQAIQNMNIMCGFEEDAGLDDFGVWP